MLKNFQIKSTYFSLNDYKVWLDNYMKWIIQHIPKFSFISFWQMKKMVFVDCQKTAQKASIFHKEAFAKKLSLYLLNPQRIVYILTLKVWPYHWDLTTTKYKRDYVKFSWGHECIHSHRRSDTNYIPKRLFQTNLDCEWIYL